MKIFIGCIIGIVIGLLVARLFWFNSFEIHFTDFIFESASLPPLDFLIETGAFKKSILGGFAGGSVGVALTILLSSRTNESQEKS